MEHLHPVDAADPLHRLKDLDAIWIRRGMRIGELLLTSREHAKYLWSAALILLGRVQRHLVALLRRGKAVA